MVHTARQQQYGTSSATPAMMAAVLVALLALLAPLALDAYTLPRLAYPLQARGSQVVDATGVPIQFRCANWPGHMETMLPEGIQWASVDDIVTMIVKSQSFNCIRLTYSADMWSTVNRSMTARQSLLSLNLTQHVTAIEKHNPSLIDQSLIEVQTAVVRACDRQNVFVLFDNQVSRPSWCCSYTDGNGWWGDQYFNVSHWLVSLSNIVRHYTDTTTGTPNAVAFSLRNELRTNQWSHDRQVSDWYQYVSAGIETITKVNDSALIFVSGLSYDTDFTFLSQAHQPNQWDKLYKSLTKTLVFEAHIYSWSGYGKITDNCTDILRAYDTAIGYGYRNDRPLVLTELGLDVDTFPSNDNDRNYWNCIIAFVQSHSLGYGIWLLSGSYLYRTSGPNAPDSFGALTAEFGGYKNQQWLQALQKMIVQNNTSTSVSERAVTRPVVRRRGRHGERTSTN